MSSESDNIHLIAGHKDSDPKNGYELENAIKHWLEDNIAQNINHQVTWAAATRAAKVIKSWWGPWTTEDYNVYVSMIEGEHPGLAPLDYECWVRWRRSEFETQEGWVHSTYSYRDDIVDSALRGGHVGLKTTSDEVDDWLDRYVSHYPNNCYCGDHDGMGRVAYRHTVADGCTGSLPLAIDQRKEHKRKAIDAGWMM